MRLSTVGFLRKTNSFVAGALAGLVFGLPLLLVVSLSHSASASTACDKVNIIYCGVSGVDNFKSIYDSNKSGHIASPTVKKDYYDLRDVYIGQGISYAAINSMTTSNTKVGTVYRDGTVKVDGNTVGTNAKVSARFQTAGATPISGTNAYIRDVTSSFASPSEQALVKMDGDTMAFAIILDCGNGVTATPVKTPAPKPTPTPTVVPSTPAPAPVESTNVNINTNTVVVQPAVVQTPPAPAPDQALACVVLTPTITDAASRAVSFATTASVTNGATISSYTYSFGDGQSVTLPSTSTTNSTTHTYTSTNNPVATVSVTGAINGQSTTVTAPACAATVNVTTPTPVTVVSTMPVALPNTGSGNAVGIFAGTSILGGLAHFFFRRRFLQA